jgi:hypothetical protein
MIAVPAPKAALERGIFERFATAARLDVEPGSIEQPDPPDIVCNIRDRGAADFEPVEFEMTAVDNGAALTRMGLLPRTREFWSQAFEKLDLVTQARLRAEHGDVQVAIEYTETGTKGQRRDSMRAVLERLAEKPRDFEGNLYNRYDLLSPEDLQAADRVARDQFKALPPGSGRTLLNLIDPPPPGIRNAAAHRFASVTEGPLAFGISPGNFERIDLSRIDAKLRREDYRSGRRLELLAYIRWGDPPSLDDRDFTAYLEQRIAGTPFTRIWLFETIFARVVARYP